MSSESESNLRRSAPRVRVRSYTPDDWEPLWAILEPIFRTGETYAVPRDIPSASAREIWTAGAREVFVAIDETNEDLVGSYHLRPNAAGPGGHVCNCGYVVSERARGRGIGALLCEHSQSAAIARGYRAMQFNLVVSTNLAAIRLWQRMGFGIVGTLPQAFEDPRFGFVDAHVMYKQLA